METAYIVTFTTMFTLVFFMIGSIIGWLANKHFFEIQPAYVHPEFMDENGNIIPDEILAVRFENDYDYDYEEEDDED